MVQSMEWKLKALTDIWTGDTNRRGDRLIPTSIIGSLRWWYEVLVRGLDGAACDPTVKEVRCPDPNKKPTDPGHHCVACELFGCTGWARKFRLMILDEDGNVMQGQITAGTTFVLRFIPLRPIREEEWCLLDATLRLIAEYGAMGGKTIFKPSDEWGIADLGEEDLEDIENGVRVRRSRKGLPLQQGDIIQAVDGQTVNSIEDLRSICASLPHGRSIKVRFRRNGGTQEKEMWAGKRHHQDFGLIKVEGHPNDLSCEQERLKAYVQDDRWRKQFDDSAFAWASLKNFWYVKERYLARKGFDTSSFNFVIGRPESEHQSSHGDSWLAGKRPDRRRRIEPESKKVFSFKEPEESRRTFGFARSEREFSLILERLRILGDGDGHQRQPDPVWQDFNSDTEFLRGEQILTQLLKREENS